MAREIFDHMKLTLGENHVEALDSMYHLAVTDYQCKYVKAETLFKDCLEKQKLILGENNACTLNTMNSLDSQEKFEEADAWNKENAQKEGD